MNELTLPPSPNWYLSNVLVCSRRGTLAWGANNVIVIAKQKEDCQPLDFVQIRNAHEEKVNALVFSPKIESDSPELLASVSGDDLIKIWDIDTLQSVAIFSFKDEKPIMAVDWSTKDNKLVYAVNSDGFLLSCNIQYETSKKISLGKLTAVCLACCPHNSNLVAIGSKNGLIYIIDLDKNGSILYKLRGHNEEIVSLSWCPVDTNILRGNNKKDLLLASGAKDKSIFIWRAGGDGRYETVLNLPKLPIESANIQSHKSKLGPTVGNWTVVCWAEPKLLLTSSVWGELLSWDLSANKDKPVHRLFHPYHNRGLFCIAIVSKCNTISDNWRTDSKFTVWTSAQDRWLICCHKQNDGLVELKRKIPTQGGYVYCMATCPIDTSILAFGAGDTMLRLWRLSEPHATTFDVSMFWQKIKGKIRAIAWNPECERSLAFATSEGRVGVFKINSNDPLLFRQYHRDIVYKLEWGSLKERNISGVFSCAEGELVLYDINHPNEAPISIIKKRCTEFSWKPDKLMLAVALENGSIMFYDQNLKKCGNTIYVFKKTVNCLVWHPESTVADTWNSPMKDYLAAASEFAIVIFDMSDLRKKLETQEKNIESIEDKENGQQRNMYKIVATLNGHYDKVVCLAWSPHFSGYLVSGSYDNIVQVWNVETQELMGTYMDHSGPVLSCMWSPIKPQLIITGSADLSLRIWDYTSSAQTPKLLSDIAKKKQKSKISKSKKTNDSLDHSNRQQNISSNSTNFTSSSANHTIEVVEPKPQVPATSALKKKDKRSYFPLHNKRMNEKFNIIDCIKNDIRKDQEESSRLSNKGKDDATKLSLFSGKEDLLAIVTYEKEAHANKSKHDVVTEMDMWCDNMKQNLECAVKEKRLNDFLVSLSSSLSMKTWKETCEAYAHQLIIEGNVEKAVSYLLCIHKIYEAIKAFLDVKMYKEAYVLARFKLDADDPVLAIVLQSWALHAMQTGQLEQAAHCYVKLGEFTKAAQILGRRTTVYCLETASKLAFMTGDEEFGMFLIKEAMTRALAKLDYSKAHSIIMNVQQFQHLKVHIDAHEMIMNTYKTRSLCESMRKWLEGKSNHKILQDLKEKHGISYYNALCNNVPNGVLEDKTTMQLYSSYQIAMAATCDKRETQLKHIATALSNVFQYEIDICEEHSLKCIETKFLTHILATLNIWKPMDENCIYAKSDHPVSTSIRAYLCIGLLNWLMTDLEQLSAEEETQFMELIEDLLDDAFQQPVRDNIYLNDKIKQLESQLATLMIDNVENGKENWANLTEELDNLKAIKKNFMEERVCAPDPHLVYNQARDFSEILRDDKNRSRFLEIVNYKYKKTNNLDSIMN